MRSTLKLAALLACLALAPARVLAYDPPAGANLIPLLGSPAADSTGLSLTSINSPWADRLNPAASATQQRPVLAAGYEALTDFGAQGLGTALALGFNLPQPYGVWGGGLRFISTPSTMTDLPLGTFLVSSVSLAKTLYPKLQVGAGLDLTLGASGGFGWGAVLNLGFLCPLGDLGPLLDFRWGGALSGIGKGYSTPSSGVTGSLGTTSLSSWPSAFTPSVGARALFVRTDNWRIGASAALSAPSFQDLSLALQAKASFRNVLSLSTSWAVDLREVFAGSDRSLIPSFALTASIPVSVDKSGSFLAKQGFEQAEVNPTLSYRPLYGAVGALGAGVSVPLGVVDRKPPRIEAKFPASTWGPFYMSPNADGTQDLLSLPVSIKDERYLEAYALVVLKGEAPALDAPGAVVVRSIANKESRPENAGFQGLWDRLTYVQKGLASPSSLTWDGRADDGSTVADGTYTVFVRALDDNGNLGVAGPFTVVVDTTPPKAVLSPADTSLIFSPDGDGNKDSLTFRLSGSVEDLWTVKVLDSAGITKRTWTFTNRAPADLTWDGTADGGAVVPDGVYSLVVQSTDRAGNTFSSRLDNLIVNTQQPPINVAIDQAVFSPNGDGRKDILGIQASVPVRQGLSSWRLAILDKDRQVRWSLGGSDAATIPARVAYDGATSSGGRLPEGSYQAELQVTYSNGYSPRILSPVFTVDVTAPSGSAKADRSAFNPAGSADQNHVTFSQAGTKDAAWLAQVYLAPSGGAAPSAPVRTWSMSGRPEATLEWDGSDDQGKPLPDGAYVYRLSAEDRAGNVFQSPLITLTLDTEKKGVRLSADLRAFNPEGADPQKRAVRLGDTVLAKDRLASFELSVESADQGGNVVRTWKGATNLVDTYTWDGLTDGGLRVPDGRYLARLRVAYRNGDQAETQSPAFVVDSVPPSLKLAASPLLFSPNGDGRLDEVAISQASSIEDSWAGRLLDGAGQVVRSWLWKGQAQDFAWDGTDEAGNPVKDGAYRYEVQSVDAAGNKTLAAVDRIVVDNRPTQVLLTASDSGISPNGDGFRDSLFFGPIVNLRDGVSSWSLVLTDKTGTEQRRFAGGAEVPARIDWDGRNAKGAVVEGDYQAVLTVDYTKGDRAVAKAGPLVVDIAGPAARVTTSPALFSPDNDGIDDELKFTISVADSSEIVDWRLEINETSVVEGAAKARERLFISWGGKGSPAPTITWDGRSSKGELVEAATDYPWHFSITDSFGNVTTLSGTIPVDVLVIKEGDRLKIKVPSIVFRANFADFNGLDADTLDRNDKVIKRIAQILNRFKDYRIKIEGHANSEGKIGGYSAAKIAEEETKELIPLSLGRADLVRKLLIENGVDPARLSTAGLGSSEPVVDFKDADNRWKNRRVEFVLIKN